MALKRSGKTENCIVSLVHINVVVAGMPVMLLNAKLRFRNSLWRNAFILIS